MYNPGDADEFGPTTEAPQPDSHVIQYYSDGGWHDYRTCSLDSVMGLMIDCAGTFATTKVRLISIVDLTGVKLCV